MSEAVLWPQERSPPCDLWLRWSWWLLLVPMSKPKEEVRVSVQEKLLGKKAGTLCP